VFTAELAPRAIRAPVAFAVELLAAVPGVVYGLWGIYVLVPVLRERVMPFLSDTLGLGASPLFAGPLYGRSMLAAALLLAIMMLPFIAAVSREVLLAVPRAQREAALALGATRWEMVTDVVLPYARSGIVGAVMLGLGRALGETMAVTMVIGNSHDLSTSLLAPAYSMAALIANEFGEATDPLHLSALMAVGAALFALTLLVNAVARWLVWRVRRRAPSDARLAPRRRRARVMTALTTLAAVLAIVPLALILAHLVIEGAAALTPGVLHARAGARGPHRRRDVERDRRHAAAARHRVHRRPAGGLGAGLYLTERRATPLAVTVRYLADVLSGTARRSSSASSPGSSSYAPPATSPRGRRHRARRAHDPARHARDRGDAARRPHRALRGRARARVLALAHRHHRRHAHRDARHRHRRAGRARARGRRDRAPALHRVRQPVLVGPPVSRSRRSRCRSSRSASARTRRGRRSVGRRARGGRARGGHRRGRALGHGPTARRLTCDQSASRSPSAT
jgi:phosphate transport system permease protein